MHEMDRTPRILTIIGLIFDGIAMASLWLFGWMFRNIGSFGIFELMQEDMTPDEWEYMVLIFDWIGNLMLIMGVIFTVIFLVNIILFTRLMKGKYDDEKAKNVYLYQAIIGGINLLSNQVTGIMYLISGVMGYKGHKEMTQKDIRRGI